MTVYSVDKLIAETRRLASEYRKAMGKPLPGVGNEIAEHDAARLLGLELVKERTGGFDAVGTGRWNGRHIQIKSRTVTDENRKGQRIGQIKVDKEWDSIMLVLMDEEYEPFEIVEAERDEILEWMDDSSEGRRKRGAMSVSRFKIIGQLVWTREDGIEDEVWDNQSSE